MAGDNKLWQIYWIIFTNTVDDFLQIHLAFWTNTSCNLDIELQDGWVIRTSLMYVSPTEELAFYLCLWLEVVLVGGREANSQTHRLVDFSQQSAVAVASICKSATQIYRGRQFIDIGSLHRDIWMQLQQCKQWDLLQITDRRTDGQTDRRTDGILVVQWFSNTLEAIVWSRRGGTP